MATKKFKCKVCGYIHEGDAAPAKCPVCGAPASEFEEIVEAGAGDAGAKKGGLFSDKNSNAYIILYSTVMVVIVAVLLSLAALSLQKRQYANELGEKKNNILQSLGVPDGDFDAMVKAYVVDAAGNKTEKPAEEVSCTADLDVTANIDKQYVPSGEQRMDLYRRMAAVRSQEDADELLDDADPLRGHRRPRDHPAHRQGAVGRHLGLYRARKGYEYRVGHRDGPQERNAGPGGRDRHAGASGALQGQDALREGRFRLDHPA